MGKPLRSPRRPWNFGARDVSAPYTTLPELGSRSFTFFSPFFFCRVGCRPLRCFDFFFFLSWRARIQHRVKGIAFNNLLETPNTQRREKVPDPVVPTVT